MEKKIIAGVLSVLLLFLLLAFVGARVMDRDYMYYDESDSYRNSNVIIYDSTEDYDAEDYYEDNVDRYSYYVDSDYDYSDDDYYYDNNMKYNDKNDDYYDKKKDSSKCYQPLHQIREKRCYRPIPQVRSSCDRNNPHGCYSEGYYGNYYSGNDHMKYDYYDCN